MIIRLHVILVSHIASRRLIEVDVRLAAGVEQPELANLGASRSANSAQIQLGQSSGPLVAGSASRSPGSPVQLVDDAVAHVARTRNRLSVSSRVWHLRNTSRGQLTGHERS